MKSETLQELELRDEIQNACWNIPVETIQNVCNSVVRRYQKCIDARGGHFEHLKILANLKIKMLFIHVLVQK